MDLMSWDREWREPFSMVAGAFCKRFGGRAAAALGSMNDEG